MKLQISARTHPGLVRRKNEDNLCLCDCVLPPDKTEKELSKQSYRPALLGVFDGMGGFVDGHRASFLAAKAASKCFEQRKKLELEDLEQICMDANAAICDVMAEDAIEYMGTTAAMVYFYGREAFLCNVGDSPIYRYRNGELSRIHKEHSERSLREALLGEAIPQSKKFKLTQYIGMPPEEIRIEPYLAVQQLSANDYYLICSDGISDMIDDDNIQQIMEEERKPAAITQKLIALAIEAGGKDNATVICVRVCGFTGLRRARKLKKKSVKCDGY